jgi:hypothetical protein
MIGTDPEPTDHFRRIQIMLAEMPGRALTYKGEADALREQTDGTRP